MNHFQHVENFNEKKSISSLEDNLKSFLDYSFLKIGAFTNINVSTSGLYANNFSKLKPALDPTKPSGSVWETLKKDWVYETGISHNNKIPISISGIYINDSFIAGPTGIPGNSYYLDYPNGNVIFSAPKPVNSNIRLNYSYRDVQIYKANESFWWKELQKYHFDQTTAEKSPGQLKVTNHKIQLPCIILETIPRVSQEPYELGNTKNIISQDILLHIYSENISQRNNLINILLLQKDNQSVLYDINKIIKEKKWPINPNGSFNTTSMSYEEIVNNIDYISNIFYIDSAITNDLGSISSMLHFGVIRWTIKIYP